MTLRARLTLGLTALATVGLLIFGFATYSLYARSRYDQVDEQLNAADPSAAVASAWEAFKKRISDLVDQVLNSGG